MCIVYNILQIVGKRKILDTEPREERENLHRKYILKSVAGCVCANHIKEKCRQRRIGTHTSTEVFHENGNNN